MSHYKRVIGGLLCGAFLLSCNAEPAEESVEVPLTQERNSDAIREMRQNALAKKALAPVEQAAEAPAIGEVPAELLAKVFADIETTTGGNRADFDLLRAESVEWRDGSLGCPQPGTSYLQAPIKGYWIVVEYLHQTYDYRVDNRGIFTLCAGNSAPGGTNPVR